MGQPAFRAAAYFILSDGREAASTVKLSFDDSNDTKHTIETSSASSPVDDVPQPVVWETPDSDEKVLDVVRDEFRLGFASLWSGKVGSAQVLSGRNMSSLASAAPPAGADYCIWLPDS